jgi:hypothetical protein
MDKIAVYQATITVRGDKSEAEALKISDLEAAVEDSVMDAFGDKFEAEVDVSVDAQRMDI